MSKMSDTLMRHGKAQRIALTLNGRERSGYCEPRELLSDFIRHELGTNSARRARTSAANMACAAPVPCRSTASRRARA
ncbi:MAG: Aerobic carbon monoxide dehydrogenase (quinone), small chain (EC [uncultured Paraburkholderia sp.]|nr:MAG: Aerobic carbon monoxide dehydrogenase (quinone), small chain (EC [uncultured Paraburkholderia sp.]CAH2938058.1 MAG: Aerobic carbon monoxide dehydrogenase (quinone), small chain (EC [uncultured Paraburkholderia sp.]